MVLKAVIAGVAVVVTAAFVVFGLQVSALSGTIDDNEESSMDRVSELESENDDLQAEIEDLRSELESVGTTTGVEKMKTQLVGLRTCFKETLAAVQQASVQGWVSNFQSGDVEGWLDLGRFSSDCEPYLATYEGD